MLAVTTTIKHLRRKGRERERWAKEEVEGKRREEESIKTRRGKEKEVEMKMTEKVKAWMCGGMLVVKVGVVEDALAEVERETPVKKRSIGRKRVERYVNK